MYKVYKNTSDERLTAEKSYSYSTKYLILNETRTVLMQLPCSEVEGSVSWSEVIKDTEYTERNFILDSSQMEKFEKWRKKKNKKNKGEIYVGAVGGAYSFVFTPTGIGTIEKVVCADGEELDLTNYDNW